MTANCTNRLKAQLGFWAMLVSTCGADTGGEASGNKIIQESPPLAGFLSSAGYLPSVLLRSLFHCFAVGMVLFPVTDRRRGVIHGGCRISLGISRIALRNPLGTLYVGRGLGKTRHGAHRQQAGEYKCFFHDVSFKFIDHPVKLDCLPGCILNDRSAECVDALPGRRDEGLQGTDSPTADYMVNTLSESENSSILN